MTRLMLEVTNLEDGKTRYITVGDANGEAPDLIANYARNYAKALLGLDHEAVPVRLALFPGGDDADDAA